MLDFNSIIIFSENPKKLAEFYKGVFQKETDWSDGSYYGFTVGTASISFGPHDKVKGENQNPERMMFNLTTGDVKAEFERIKGLGVAVVSEPYQMEGGWIATFADPDNNYFQVMTAWEGKN